MNLKNLILNEMFDTSDYTYSMKKFITINDKYLYAEGIKRLRMKFDLSLYSIKKVLTDSISGKTFNNTIKDLCHNVDYKFDISDISMVAKDAIRWCDDKEKLNLKSMELFDLLIVLTQICVCLQKVKDERFYEVVKCSYEKIPYLDEKIQTYVNKISQCLDVLKSRFRISFPIVKKELETYNK